MDRLAMLYVPHGGDSFPFEELAKGATHARVFTAVVGIGVERE